MAQLAHDSENLSSTPRIHVKKLNVSQENNVRASKLTQQVKVFET